MCKRIPTDERHQQTLDALDSVAAGRTIPHQVFSREAPSFRAGRMSILPSTTIQSAYSACIIPANVKAGTNHF